MALKKQKTDVRQKLKDLVKTQGYLSEDETKEWMNLADSLPEEHIEEAVHYFKETEKEASDYKMQLLFEHKLGDKYKNELTSIANEAKREMLKKQEEFEKEEGESTEDILKKLNDL